MLWGMRRIGAGAFGSTSAANPIIVGGIGGEAHSRRASHGREAGWVGLAVLDVE